MRKISPEVAKHMDNLSNEAGVISALAIDQRGSLKRMLAEAANKPADETTIVDFKKAVSKELTPYASAILTDPEYGLPATKVRDKRGKRRFLRIRKLKQNLPRFKKLAAVMNNGLENRLNTFVEGLSGGQRQALSFLMATIERPDILLLDEHTAALDPHTSENLLAVTDQQIKENKLTALMITHHMEDALKYGNRLLVLKDGKVKADINEREKQNLKVSDLYKYFED